MSSEQMIDWARDLFPINRSLTGEGVRKTLEYLKALNPEIELHSVASGSPVFDWTVPQEWSVRDALLEHIETGQRFAEFSKSNLHLVGYSEPVDAVMNLSELRERLHTHTEQADWIPYVTRYYKRTWGFCLAENDLAKMPEGAYRVFIDSTLFDGELLFADAVFEGETKQEVFFSTYVCHPSMANNEVSGPVLASALMKFLKEHYPKCQ